uniref:Neurexin/syndecan/glycophorin C domain-containing protein n=1 Tax=Sinocyclocheilus rhinocerous TaxID=307959 RepID=A0A673KKV4_9TELE
MGGKNVLNVFDFGISVIAVVVMILLIMIVVLRFMAHQKGTYYTHEETLAFKSDPEVQESYFS